MIIFQYMAFTAIVYNGWRARTDLLKTSAELDNMNLDFENLRGMMMETEVELNRANADFATLKSKLNKVNPVFNMNGKGIQSSEERKLISEKIMTRHDAQAERIGSMQKYIQAADKNALEEK